MPNEVHILQLEKTRQIYNSEEAQMVRLCPEVVILRPS